VFTPVLAKHSKSFSLVDCIALGVDRMQRNFGSMRKKVETWKGSELTDVTAKVVIYEYEAFVEGKREAPKHLARTVHDLYFEPKYEEFRSRTIWRLWNAFTSAFKELEPIPQFKANSDVGRIHGSSVLTVVLTVSTVPAGPALARLCRERTKGPSATLISTKPPCERAGYDEIVSRRGYH
jgi:hypothetical protein